MNIDNAYAVLEHNKIHDNFNGGVRAEAQTGASHVQLRYNRIDSNGASANTFASGIAVVGGAELNSSTGDLMRLPSLPP